MQRKGYPLEARDTARHQPMSITHIREGLRACQFLATVHPQFRWSQYRFLLVVAETPGLNQSEVAKKLDVTLAAVSRAVDVFGPKGRRDRGGGGRGYVSTIRDPEDDRNLLLSITPAGLSFLEQLHEHLWPER